MGSYGQEGNIVIFGHWVPKEGKMDELLEAFNPVLKYASQNTNTISCFYLLKEKKEDDTGAVITSSCFKTRKAYDEYLSSPEKATLDKTCKKQGLLIEPQREQALETAAGFPFRSIGVHSDPGVHAVMAKIQYAPGMRSQGIEQWQKVAASVEEKEKEGTYSYWFLTDPDDADVLYSLERYKDAAYLWDVHVPSEAIQQNIQRQKDIRTGLLLRVFASVE